MASPSWRAPITMTAITKLSGWGHATNSVILAKIRPQACSTSSAPTRSDLPRRRWTCSGVSSRETSSAMAQQLARMGVGRLAVAHRDLAVDEDIPVALGALDAAPFAAREVVHYLVRQDSQPIEVVDHDVGRRALLQHAAAAEAGHL